jgi:Skp family chaperone for outer membrane proteins
MNKTIWIIVLVAIVALVGGFFGGRFTAEPSADLQERVSSLEQRLEELQAALEELKKQRDLEALQSRLASVEGQLEGIDVGKLMALTEELKGIKAELEQAAAAGRVLRIAYVDAEKIFVEYKGTEAAVQKFKEERQKREEELLSIQKQYEAGEISRREYENKVAQVQLELQKLDLQLTAEIQKKMLEFIREVGEEMGYDWVTRRKDVILYAKEGVIDDITDIVLERMNAALEEGQ